MRKTGGNLWRRLESLEALVLPDDEPIIINVIFGAQKKGELPSFVVELPGRVRSESSATLAEAAVSMIA